MTTTRIALVTGGNRGIGIEIVRGLSRLGVVAVIGARDVAKGQEAADALKSEGIDVPVVAYDAEAELIGSEAENGAEAAIAEVKRLFGRCDVLVNNAAILIDGPGGFNASLFDLKSMTARRTFETNLLAPIGLVQAVVPLMKEQGYGRIVNVSSSAGQLSEMGAGYPAYRMSKTAMNAMTRIVAAELKGFANIKINACCPGWVRTAMGGPEATRSPEEGADTPVWLATLPDDGPTGGFFRDRKPLAW